MLPPLDLLSASQYLANGRELRKKKQIELAINWQKVIDQSRI